MKDSKQRSDQNIDTAPAFGFGETEFSSIVVAGGGKYVGVLKEIPDKMESVILFDSPRTRTTLGIPISRLTVDAVREHFNPERIQAARLSLGAVPLLPHGITKVVPGRPDEGQCAKRPPRAARRLPR